MHVCNGEGRINPGGDYSNVPFNGLSLRIVVIEGVCD